MVRTLQRERVEPEAARPEQPGSWLEQYGLAKDPFAAQETTDHYKLFPSHKRVFESLLDHLVNGKGLLILGGESGVGKSTMLRVASEVAAGEEFNVASISLLKGPGLHPSGLPAPSDPRPNSRRVFLIDDADLAPPDLLEWLSGRLPDNLAIVATITADPGPDPNNPLLRVANAAIRLPRLTTAETKEYIERALWIAGGSTWRLMDTEALRLIVYRSGGVPGAANRLMEAAFTAGFVRGDPMITAKTISTIVGPRPRRRIEWDIQASRVMPMIGWTIFAAGAWFFLYRAIWETAATVTPPVRSVPQATHQPAPPPPMAPDVMTALMRRGEQALTLGDIGAARLAFSHAAEAGNAQAATSMGKTYDPNFLASGPAQGERPDKEKAVTWYRKAVALGDPRAADLLKALGG